MSAGGKESGRVSHARSGAAAPEKKTTNTAREAHRQQQDSEGTENETYGRDVTTLGLNDGERGERSTAVLVGKLGGTLEETRVEVEDVSRVGLTSGGTTEKERHLTVGDGLDRKSVV